MALALNFSQVERKSFEALPKGTYAVRVDKVTEQTSKNGNLMLNVQLKVIDGEYENRVIFDYITLTEAAMWRVQDALIAMGLISEDDVDFELDPSDMIGCECQVKVVIDQQGDYEPSNKVKSYLPL